METKSLLITITCQAKDVYVNYFLTDFDGVTKSSFGKLYLIARLGGTQQIDIAEVVDERTILQEAWIKRRVEENVRLYFKE